MVSLFFIFLSILNLKIRFCGDNSLPNCLRELFKYIDNENIRLLMRSKHGWHRNSLETALANCAEDSTVTDWCCEKLLLYSNISHNNNIYVIC
jgi:hypothetical protein